VYEDAAVSRIDARYDLAANPDLRRSACLVTIQRDSRETFDRYDEGVDHVEWLMHLRSVPRKPAPLKRAARSCSR
jgi:hypothetical protein